MFCMSLHHPKYKKRNIIDAVPGTSLDYFYARQQFLEYKTLYDEVIGDFQFFDYRVTYEPGSVVSETTNRTGVSLTKHFSYISNLTIWAFKEMLIVIVFTTRVLNLNICDHFFLKKSFYWACLRNVLFIIIFINITINC